MLEDAHGDWSKTTWHAGLDYQVTSQNLVYAKADSGYKAGGFTDFGPYKPESLLAYEVGSKNWFLGRRLQANLDAFYYNYKDQQVTEYLLTSTGTNILNAGQSRMYGGELQTTALLTDADQVDFSAAYLHAYYKDFSVAEGPVNVQFAGNQIIQSPTWSLSAGLQHVFPVGSGTLTPRLQSQYRSSSYLQFFNLPWDRQAAYTSTDVLVTYVPPDRKWNVQGYVRNLENSVILTNADNGGPYNAVRYQFAAPRTFGARVQYNW
jgi:iron complex outermembrane receptor protein